MLFHAYLIWNKLSSMHHLLNGESQTLSLYIMNIIKEYI
jgi:hypothetical protein